MGKFILAVLICISTLIKGYCQDFHVSLIPSQKLPPSVKINDIFEDLTGYLWLATDQGLFQFNGKTFVLTHKQSYHHFTILNDSTTLVLGDARIDILRAGQPIDSSLNKIIQAKASMFSYLRDAVSAGGEIYWLLTDKGILKLEKKSLLKVIPEDYTGDYSGCVVSSVGENILLISREGKIYRWKNEIQSTVALPLNTAKKSFEIQTSTTDSALLILDSAKIILVNNNLQIINNPIRNFPLNNSVTTLSIWKDRILLGTNNGLWIGQKANRDYSFKRVMDGSEPHRTNELPFKEIKKIFCSKDGNIWIALSDGTALLQERPFRPLSKEIPLASFEQIVFLENGKTYMEGSSGLFECIKNENKEYHGAISPVSMNQIVGSIAAHGNRLWLSSLDYKVYYFENNERSNSINLSDRGNTIFFMMSDSRGNVWASQAPSTKPIVGILKITPNLTVIDYGRNAGFENRMLVTRESTDGKIYCAGIGENTYLYQYDPAHDRFINISAPLKFDYGENFEVHDIVPGFQGEIWLASTAGLLLFKNNTIDKINFEELYDNEVVGITMAQDSSIWFSTDRSGVVRYKNGMYNIFNQKAGFASNAMNYRAITVDPDGTILASSQEGIFTSSQEAHTWRKTKKPIMLGVRDSDLRLIHSNSFRYQQTLIFEFASLMYPAETIEYSYRLLGFNNDRWTNLAKQDTLILTNLRSGNYALEIRGKQVGGYQWSDPQIYSFYVNPVWYLQRMAFVAYLLFTVLIILASVLTYNRRLRRAKKIWSRKSENEHWRSARRMKKFRTKTMRSQLRWKNSRNSVMKLPLNETIFHTRRR